MKVIIAKNYEDGARKAADVIEKIVRDNPECTNMVRAEDKLKGILPYAAKQAIRIKFAGRK